MHTRSNNVDYPPQVVLGVWSQGQSLLLTGKETLHRLRKNRYCFMLQGMGKLVYKWRGKYDFSSR